MLLHDHHPARGDENRGDDGADVAPRRLPAQIPPLYGTAHRETGRDETQEASEAEIEIRRLREQVEPVIEEEAEQAADREFHPCGAARSLATRLGQICDGV